MIDPSELNLSSLPWLPLEEKSAFPRKPAIYFAIDAQDNIQYIGRSVDPKSRWHRHHRYEQLEEIGSIRIAYLFVDLPGLLPGVEAALIKWFQPPLNVVGRSVLAGDEPIREEPSIGEDYSLLRHQLRFRDRYRFVEGKDYRVGASGHSSIFPSQDRGYGDEAPKSAIGKILYIAKNEMSDEDLLRVGLSPNQIVSGNLGDSESIDAIADWLGLIPNAWLDGLFRIRRQRIMNEKGYLEDEMETVDILRSLRSTRSSSQEKLDDEAPSNMRQVIKICRAAGVRDLAMRQKLRDAYFKIYKKHKHLVERDRQMVYLSEFLKFVDDRTLTRLEPLMEVPEVLLVKSFGTMFMIKTESLELFIERKEKEAGRTLQMEELKPLPDFLGGFSIAFND